MRERIGASPGFCTFDPNGQAGGIGCSETGRPDIVLLAVDRCDMGAEPLLRQAIVAWKPASVLVLTQSEDIEANGRFVRAGARGVFPGPFDALLLTAIRKVCDGQIWFARECLSRIIDAMAVTGRPHPDFPDVRAFEVLTEREREVAGLVTEGLHNKVIAARLGIAENTVGRHLTAIYAKLGVFDRVELAIRYLQHRSEGGAKA